MGTWFPAIYDTAMKPLEEGEFKRIRKQLVTGAAGRVLEIGYGTGVNFPFYRSAVSVDAIEPNPSMAARAEKKLQDARVPIRLSAASAEKLPFPDDTFDTVVATLVFCTIPDPEKALREIQRVSRQGAKLLFFEHVRLRQPVLRKLQDWLNPMWSRVCDGCQLNRDTLGLIRKVEITVDRVDEYYGKLFLAIEGKNGKMTADRVSPEERQ
ncbi:class I SAM-dependent methyltransferase [Sporosarcina trichiuri]|uniref:class I SAM-dependent methyltransferase n=1 Tax=Sporosarcina trichiuri TaxID=3056445 RepID=UPI0025B508DB|nr:class I SAM-dependent methyltransferase [Sporosarcina sp. 0.2-SM1T-5]WJY27590.1 class I SAM-dependent methyltransferase [Sporosarcina sp. 0.2-SM1T-5]